MTSMQTPFLEHGGSPALAMLRELEISLAASQRPLLSGDVTALELEIARQIRLFHWIEGQLDGQIDTLTGDSETIAEMRAVSARVRHLGRVQSALLARASQRLRMIANVVAGPQALYAASATRCAAHSTAVTLSCTTALNGESPCRA
jgi:hypothetical protein